MISPMRKILVVLSILCSINYAQAQLWKEMMHDPTVNIYEVVEQAELYFENVDKEAKGSGWKSYQRWLYENEPKYYPTGDRSKTDPYFVSSKYDEILRLDPSGSRSPGSTGWRDLGTHYIEVVTGHYSLGLGRVESFYVDPDNDQRIYLGSRSGGFWKTMNGGATWSSSTTDFLLATGVNTMTASPGNPDSVLINVRNSRNGTTHGIYRSVDAGDSWAVTEFNPSNLGWGGLGTNNRINQVAYHPTVSGLVFIATSEGLFRSADDLTSWTVPVVDMEFSAIAFHPLNSDIIYASTNDDDNLIYVSFDGGLTFDVSGAISGNSSNIKLSTSGDCPSCVFVRSSDGIWKSANEGQNFALLSNPEISNYGGFAVSDVDARIMLIGDIDAHMSYNEGQDFNKVTFWSQGNANYNTTGTYVHADIRGAKCINGVFWVNTDGFLCKSVDNGATWQIFEGQSIREYYNLGLSQSNHERTICGSQDNGTSIKTEDAWVEFYGADGMEGIIHPLNDDWMIGSLQYGGRRRTKDGGLSQDGVTPDDEDGAWIAPLFYDPNDQMVVYHAAEYIYRSDDFGSTWTKLGTPGFTGSIRYATIAENNSNIIVVTNGGDIEKSIDGGNTFVDIQGDLPNSYITDVAFDPNDDNVIIVTYSRHQNDNAKVFISVDQGATWSNITHNLNNMPIRAVVIDHTNESTIYLGAEIGVYKKAMADSSWTLYNPNLPNMSILELEVMYGSNTLRAATWGRGLWEYDLQGRKSFPSILTTRITDQPTESKPLFGVDQFVSSTISYPGEISSAFVQWSVDQPDFSNVISMSVTSDSTWTTDMPIPNQSEGARVYFKVFAVGGESDTTETYKFMYKVREHKRCNSYGNLSYATAVTLVDFNSIHNATGKTQPYTDYTTTDSTAVAPGSTHDLSVNLNTDGDYTIFAKAWIDWNQDVDYDDPGEEYDLGTAINTQDGPTTFSPIGITVPLDAKPGITTMRVSARYNSSPDPCGTGFDGEVEDYSIIVGHVYLTETRDTSICAYDSIFLEGQWQTEAGIYVDTIPVSSSIDSIYITNLSIGQMTMSIDTQVACDIFTWIDGNTYTESNDTAMHTLTNSANCDSVVTLNLTIEKGSSSAIDVTTCDSYTVPSGKTTYSESGIYFDTISNVTGCDSVITIYLDVIEIDTSVTVIPPTLMSNAENARYQWINCETMEALVGDTSQSYVATSNGLYAVEITHFGCKDTSACHAINKLGILNNDFGDKLIVFPNPTTAKFVVDLGVPYLSIQVKIHNANGQLIGENEFYNSSEIALEVLGPVGAYFVELIATGGKRATIKIMKQ
ncbi:MAG: hypothetical protein DRI69_07500 [Bacteroidetes bacterium]|nr:MAG: hypothetical protein DRI69_07500 [Bacteroidota bacterium]